MSCLVAFAVGAKWVSSRSSPSSYLQCIMFFSEFMMSLQCVPFLLALQSAQRKFSCSIKCDRSI
jgi:hypothetical protein